MKGLYLLTAIALFLEIPVANAQTDDYAKFGISVGIFLTEES